MYKVVCFLILIGCCVSCNYSTTNKKNTTESLDTIVDFSTVDVSPSFKECEQLLGNEKTSCFRNSVQEKFTKGLKQYAFSSEADIEETILVVITINHKGKIGITEVQSSEFIQEKLPNLSDILGQMVDSLPKLFPATKRGIPVTVQYELPIEIKTTK